MPSDCSGGWSGSGSIPYSYSTSGPYSDSIYSGTVYGTYKAWGSGTLTYNYQIAPELRMADGS